MPGAAETTRRHRIFARRYGYGLVLVMILVSLAFQMAAPDTDSAQAVTIVLQGITLLLAVWASRADHIVVRMAEWAVAIVVVSAAVTFLIAGSVDDGAARLVNVLLIAFAPVAIAAGIVRHGREERAVTMHTMFGVLCIYLLLGMLFSFIYGVVSAVGSTPFFAEIHGGNPSDFTYFSFETITTTGFGDLTAATDLGRSLTILEALIGQIYLVTVVALIVSNIRPPARRRNG